MRYHRSGKCTSTNEFGDIQLDLDLKSDVIFFEALRQSGVVYAGLSEETPDMTYLCPDGEFIVTFDPLDGSSIVEANHAVGSIFAIWKRTPGKDNLDGYIGKEMVGAALSVYGSRTAI